MLGGRWFGELAEDGRGKVLLADGGGTERKQRGGEWKCNL
jgi:hypothetical protein